MSKRRPLVHYKVQLIFVPFRFLQIKRSTSQESQYQHFELRKHVKADHHRVQRTRSRQQKMSINLTVAVPLKAYMAIRNSDPSDHNYSVEMGQEIAEGMIAAVVGAIMNSPYDVSSNEGGTERDEGRPSRTANVTASISPQRDEKITLHLMTQTGYRKSVTMSRKSYISEVAAYVKDWLGFAPTVQALIWREKNLWRGGPCYEGRLRNVQLSEVCSGTS